jgi:hypothetical protein
VHEQVRIGDGEVGAQEVILVQPFGNKSQHRLVIAWRAVALTPSVASAENNGLNPL